MRLNCDMNMSMSKIRCNPHLNNLKASKINNYIYFIKPELSKLINVYFFNIFYNLALIKSLIRPYLGKKPHLSVSGVT